MQKQVTKGALLVFVSAVLMSTGGLFIKLIPWNAMAINSGRNIIACIITFGYMLATKKKLKISVPILLCGMCLTLNTILYTLSVRLTTAANAVVIQYTSPAFIVLYMWVLFKQKPRKLDVVTCGLVISGIALFFLDGFSGGGMAGNVLAVFSAAAYAVVFLVNMFEKSDAFSSFFLGQMFSAVIGLPWLLFEPNKTAASVTAVVVMGVFQMGLAYIFMSKGLTYISPVMANIICMMEPILNPILVAVFYGEKMGVLSIIGMVIVIGVLLAYNIINAKIVKLNSGKEKRLWLKK